MRETNQEVTVGKHGNEADGNQGKDGDKDYQPKHAGGQDGYEWAKNWTPPPAPSDKTKGK